MKPVAVFGNRLLRAIRELQQSSSSTPVCETGVLICSPMECVGFPELLSAVYRRPKIDAPSNANSGSIWVACDGVKGVLEKVAPVNPAKMDALSASLRLIFFILDCHQHNCAAWAEGRDHSHPSNDYDRANDDIEIVFEPLIGGFGEI